MVVAIILVVIVVLAPIAFYRKFISRKTRGPVCPACHGFGQFSGGRPCNVCGGGQVQR
jgi:hypothetical protein